MLSKKNCCQSLLVIFLLTGCTKNLTKYFPDADAPGLTVFSDKSNNILSCYINEKPWKTIDRISYARFSGPVGTDYELYINKIGYGALQDTMAFVWEGYFPDDTVSSYLKLILSVKKDFNKNDFSSLSGERLVIDSTSTGYFCTNINGTNINIKGNGSIYFHKATFDSAGYLGGLIEANIGGVQLTKGRFDEALTYENVNFD
jgi:hypothetical protein